MNLRGLRRQRSIQQRGRTARTMIPTRSSGTEVVEQERPFFPSVVTDALRFSLVCHSTADIGHIQFSTLDCIGLLWLRPRCAAAGLRVLLGCRSQASSSEHALEFGGRGLPCFLPPCAGGRCCSCPHRHGMPWDTSTIWTRSSSSGRG